MYESKVIHDQYEISIWDDIWNSTLNRFAEEKIGIIGSDTMTAPHRAIDPTLTQNTNGTETLTFSIYYRYIDPFDGKDAINPFIKLLINERKLKLHWKDKWYDFIIKNKVESSDGKSFQYTCESLAANELTKTGFNLEFDTELANNTDTVWNLAETVLEGTDWRLADQTGKNFKETVEETGYKVAISSGGNVLLFYSVVSQATEDSGSILVQYWAPVADQPNVDNRGLLIDGACYSHQGSYTKSSGNIIFTFQDRNHNNLSITYPAGTTLYDYRAKRDVQQQKTVYSPPLKRYVGEYTYNNDIIYGYTTASYVSPEVVTNLIVNDKNFKDTNGWLNAIGFTLYPIYDRNTVVANYYPKSYLITDKHNLGNNCFLHNTTYMPEGLVKNDKLIFKINVKKAEYDEQTQTYTLSHFNTCPIPNSGTASGIRILKYYYDNEDGVYKPDNRVEGDPYIFSSYEYLGEETEEIDGQIQGTGTYVYRVTITHSLSLADLVNNKIGAFVRLAASSYSGRYAIEYSELYFEREDANGNILEPNSIDSTSVITYETRYFERQYNNPGLSESDIKWLYVGISHTDEASSKWNDAKPVLDENCEKIRTITGKNSTRYNWLQTLAETFEVWCRFWVEHDENGNIEWEEVDGTFYPKKYVTFVDRIGELADYGFIYGIDLKSIQRTVDSSQIATKIIVPQNSNEFAENGFCTIQRSSENYSGENYIIDLDYYADNGLIDRGRLYTDLYEPQSENSLGYYQELHRLNSEYDYRAEQIAALKDDLDRQQSYLTVYEGLLDSTLLEITNIEWEIDTLVAKYPDGVPTGYTESTVEDFMADNPDWQKLVSLYNTLGNLKENRDSYITIIGSDTTTPKTGLKGSIYDINVQLYGDPNDETDDGLIGLQEVNREARQDLVDAFNQRYSRYIQEGTWSSEDYIDDTKYYLDAKGVAYEAARPKLSYNISVIRLSALEEFKNKVFQLGDISWIEDEDFFMARYREEVVITQLVSHLDSPENDSITVQNYRTKFQDLFQRTEATIQSFQYGEGSYNRVAAIMESDGTINVDTLQNSILANNELMSQNSLNNAITTGPDGITVTDISNLSNKVKITANGIFITTDGGNNWINAIKGTGISTNALSAGVISTSDIVINGSQGNTFRWDDTGISAYYYDGQAGFINTNHFVRLDRFGLYGILNYTEEDPTSHEQVPRPFKPEDEEDVFENAAFGMTWNRFFMRNKYDNHYVEISSDNDIRIMNTNGTAASTDDTELIKIGTLIPAEFDDQGALITPGVYGLRIKDENDNIVMQTDSNGRLWLQNALNIGTTESGSYLASIGYLPLVTNTVDQIKWDDDTNLDTRTIGGTSDIIHRNLAINNKFVVWEDGTVYASDGYFEGTINATSGTFTGNVYATGGWLGQNGLIIDGGDLVIYGQDENDNPIPIFKFDGSTKQLNIIGNGTFTGDVYANNGVFTGTVNATDGVFNGIVHATGGDFTGNITAISGDIGGFEITANTIQAEGLILNSGYISGNVNYPSSISVDNIDIGTGASIRDYINLGDSARLYGNSNPDLLLTAGEDGNHENPSIIIYKDGTAKLGALTFDGVNSNIFSGSSWSITPTTATFNDIVATGKIVTSIFEYNKMQVAGGTMLFRPIFEIKSIESTGNTGEYNIILDVSTDLNIGTVLKLLKSTDSIYLDSVDNQVVNGIITAYNNESKIYTFQTSSSIDNIDIYRYALHLGEYDATTGTISNALIIGINSTSNEGFIQQRGLSIKEPASYSSNNYAFIYDTIPRLYLGDLSTIAEKIGVKFEEGQQYGLYSDNVILKGSLTTILNSGSTIPSYAGINTKAPVASEKIANISDTDNNNIVFWAGSASAESEQIAIAPFQVTKDGSIYANKGLFEGSIITKAIIQASAFYGADIYGWDGQNNSPAILRIHSTRLNADDAGIKFIDDGYTGIDSSITLSIGPNGFIKGDGTGTPFINLSNNTIIFNGTSAVLDSATINGFEINNSRFTKDNAYLEITSTNLVYQDSDEEIILQVTKNLVTLDANEVQVIEDFTLGDNIMNYKQAVSNNAVVGYDLYI